MKHVLRSSCFLPSRLTLQLCLPVSHILCPVSLAAAQANAGAELECQKRWRSHDRSSRLRTALSGLLSCWFGPVSALCPVLGFSVPSGFVSADGHHVQAWNVGMPA
ncbi:hypothetical protein DPEC_G00259690 [Dallia pectoralis]|uniref:Uncharacterized protein n=1 Tax=Dallia pectoralis TaxID=75939 RepID=A0ACC2FRQ4_DALPE|nr:hypothetical protein DPEC_G00259690 [Dallia pectoralis]